MTELIDTAPVLSSLPASQPRPATAPAANDRRPSAARLRIFVVDGRQIRRLRRQQGLTQAVLAARAGISLVTVSKLERQVCASCHGRTLGRIAAALSEPPALIMYQPGVTTDPPS